MNDDKHIDSLKKASTGWVAGWVGGCVLGGYVGGWLGGWLRGWLRGWASVTMSGLAVSESLSTLLEPVTYVSCSSLGRVTADCF